MPATNSSRIREWVTAQQTVATLAAILVALPAAYAFETAFAGSSGSFLILMTLGVGVPMAYDEYWSSYDRMRTAVGWVLVACAVAAGAFVGCYLVGTGLLSLDPFLAGVGAFLVTDLGGLALLRARQRE
ncbi:hypothetical protein [Haloglomus salinum]|uniref:hypothetical protein n=1 Tax=Haloglomus salinum TaxID=2962673 RepID=UPI0020CA0B94|nr:hypothetical protein [Haloglomus salinum]